MNKILSEKEQKRRNYILNGPLWKVILTISAPLAIYGLFNYLYGFFDLLMVSHIGGNEVASVVFIDEIKNAVMAFGAGIAAGFFYGLPEQPIKSISLENISFDYAKNPIADTPAMMSFLDKMKGEGLQFRYVNRVSLKNVKINQPLGKPVVLENVLDFNEV